MQVLLGLSNFTLRCFLYSIRNVNVEARMQSVVDETVAKINVTTDANLPSIRRVDSHVALQHMLPTSAVRSYLLASVT
jgi:fructose/tagatose bisphosphate aldolase